MFRTFQTKQAGEDFHVCGNYLYALEDQHSLAISEVKEEYQKGDQMIDPDRRWFANSEN